jgi:hypothetical protein
MKAIISGDLNFGAGDAILEPEYYFTLKFVAHLAQVKPGDCDISGTVPVMSDCRVKNAAHWVFKELLSRFIDLRTRLRVGSQGQELHVPMR